MTEIKTIKVQENLKEHMARFAHEGLPYMTDDENWFEFNKDWAIIFNRFNYTIKWASCLAHLS